MRVCLLYFILIILLSIDGRETLAVSNPAYDFGMDEYYLQKDSDSDGVPDIRDECPGTGEGIEVDNKGCPKDSDEDGLINTIDRCPFLMGDVSAEGCPDRDGDGVEDIHDNCPFVAGTVIHRGCPDTDGDGITDKQDNCPDIFGSRLADGCPDRDNDGVLDDSDKCPFLKGSVTNDGCPDVIPDPRDLASEESEIFQKALKEVKFSPGEAKLISDSYNILDNIVLLMQKKGSYNLLIIGHTDSNGSENWNRVLSEKRAQVVRSYIIANDIEPARVSAIGKGEEDPVSNNNTWKGRETNRRIEFQVY